MKTFRGLLILLWGFTFALCYGQKDAVRLVLLRGEEAGSWYLKVAFDNKKSANYTAFQMDLHLPEGFEWNIESLNVEPRLVAHHCSAALVGSETLRVIAYSAVNQEIPDRMGNLFGLKFSATEEAVGGHYAVEARGIEFTKRDGVKVDFPVEDRHFNYKKTEVGVEELTAETLVEVYRLNGKKIIGGVFWQEALQALKHGVYVVNGKTIYVR